MIRPNQFVHLDSIHVNKEKGEKNLQRKRIHKSWVG